MIFRPPGPQHGAAARAKPARQLWVHTPSRHNPARCRAADVVKRNPKFMLECSSEQPERAVFESGVEDADKSTETTAVQEAYPTLGGCEKRIVTAPLNIITRFEMGTALADENGTGADGLAIAHLGSETLCVGIPTVPAGSLSLLMSHNSPSGLDTLDAHVIVILSVSLGFFVALPTFLLEDDHLVSTDRTKNLGSDDGALNHGPSDLQFLSPTDQHDPIEAQGIACLKIRFGPLDRQDISGTDPILFSAMLNDCILCHDTPLLENEDGLFTRSGR